VLVQEEGARRDMVSETRIFVTCEQRSDGRLWLTTKFTVNKDLASAIALFTDRLVERLSPCPVHYQRLYLLPDRAMRLLTLFLTAGGISFQSAAAFSTTNHGKRSLDNSASQSQRTTTSSSLSASQSPTPFHELRVWTAVSLFTAASILTPSSVLADEIGQEREAPTIFTGETVEICVKRGPLGACQKTELRTETNDNDVAKKYFRDPSDLIKQKEAAMRAESEDAGNSLIEKLRQQSIDNQEKNDLYVARKTFEADQVRMKCFVVI